MWLVFERATFALVHLGPSPEAGAQYNEHCNEHDENELAGCHVEHAFVAIMVACTETRECPVVVGLGANVGSPRAQLRGALQALRSLSEGSMQVASLYRSAPIGPEQPDFLNSAAALEWSGSLELLLVRLHDIEREFGRQRNERWGPRTLDLDLLWAGERCVVELHLTVPHPELLRRAFALYPLVELVPDARDPSTNLPYGEFVPAVHSQRIERVAGPGWAVPHFN